LLGWAEMPLLRPARCLQHPTYNLRNIFTCTNLFVSLAFILEALLRSSKSFARPGAGFPVQACTAQA
jgi:hypothetical protein